MNYLALGGLLLAGVSTYEYTHTTHENWLASLGQVVERIWFPNYIWEDLVPRFHFENPEWKYPYSKPCVPFPQPTLERDYRVHGSSLDRDAIQRAIWFYTDPKWAKLDSNYHKSWNWDERAPGEPKGDNPYQWAHIGEIVNYALYNVHYELEDPDQTDFAIGASPIADSSTWMYTPPKTYKGCTPVEGVGGVPHHWQGPKGQPAVDPRKYTLGRLMGAGTEDLADTILGGEIRPGDLPYNEEFFSVTPYATNEATKIAVETDAANQNEVTQFSIMQRIAREAGTSYTFAEDGALFQPPAITAEDIIPVTRGPSVRSGASILAGGKNTSDVFSTSSDARVDYLYKNPPLHAVSDGYQWQGDGTWDYVDRQSGSSEALSNQSKDEAANYVTRILTRDLSQLETHPGHQ